MVLKKSSELELVNVVRLRNSDTSHRGMPPHHLDGIQHSIAGVCAVSMWK